MTLLKGGGRLSLVQRIALPGAWLLLIIGFGIANPHVFLTPATFQTMFGSQAVLLVLTLALIVPLTAGDYDLSVGAVLTLSAMMIAILNVQYGWPIWAAILAALAMGLLVGFLNGVIMVFFGIESLIVTLGMGTLLGGITLWVSNSATISGISHTLVDWVIVKRFGGISLAFFYAIGLCALLWWIMEYTSIGRRLLFVGRGRNVSKLSGVRVGRVRVGALMGSSTLAAVAGVLYAGTSGGADPTSGTNLLLPAFAAAFLGATSIMPGRFNPWGTAIAVYFLVTGITGLQLMGIQSYVQQLFYGGALLVAVALSQLSRRRVPLDNG
ncbi:ABC transporter permease [Arthrobacter sp. MMS18-M83]|uniref:ABC transporter permease n=1 Tax=unclassified Arthrobacter TaxID=235627 RepID=UPI00227C1DF9|nr:ABC transporter permease [Arthrobacter sp. MMS18-M83]UKA64607.1 ABC transporter permease [Arthrobacter sp. FW306-04-A]WAH97229.1 ABC transporter permease [Arthrobacter sp. MMS18-M83]